MTRLYTILLACIICAPLSAKEVRLATILREMPYAVSFGQRVAVFTNLISRDKQEHQGDRVNFMAGPSINILVRRNYLYEDSFEKLSPENGTAHFIS